MIEFLAMRAMIVMVASFMSIIFIAPTHALSTILAYITTYITHRKCTKWHQYNTFFYQKIITPIAIAASITFVISIYVISNMPPKIDIISNYLGCAIFVLCVILITTEVLKRIPRIKTAASNIQRSIYYLAVVPLNIPLYIGFILTSCMYTTH